MTRITAQLADRGVLIPCGPFNVRIFSDCDEVAAGMEALYADFPLLGDDKFVDFEVSVRTVAPLHRYFRPLASFHCDGRTPFKPLPVKQAFALLERGLNWTISAHAHDCLVVQSAVVERDGRALLLPADPCSGKSTLCAALVLHGWRLLSDELALIDLATGMAIPIARPVNLKNRSIDVIRSLGPGIQIGPVCTDAAIGDVAHMRPPASSVGALGCPAIPAMVVFSNYEAGCELEVQAQGKAWAFGELMRHTVNFPLLGTDGFDAIARLLGEVEVFHMRYPTLAQALPEIERLWGLPA